MHSEVSLLGYTAKCENGFCVCERKKLHMIITKCKCHQFGHVKRGLSANILDCSIWFDASFFLSVLLSFFLFLYHPFFFFLFLWWFLPNLHQSRQCSDKYLYTFLNFCKISPSPKVVTKYITRWFYIVLHTSLQQSTLLSAMNESIYVFTSLPEPKLSFFFIFVTSMGKKWCFL